ncbi:MULTISPECIES: hypothetical protein [Xanthobacter]|uniref:hypothetical protein n=1 Tax=Xanthobacter TaxID=279 RepID=UPI001F405E92|nr:MULTISPECIES: hypothetical protein [unclassified Xanthobacter]
MARAKGGEPLAVSGRLTQVPGLQWLNHVRHASLDHAYGSRVAAGQDAVVRALRERGARTLALTIAYNAPEAVALLADSMARFLPHTPLLVCDTSCDAEARTRHAVLAGERRLPYLALPPVPFTHGLSARISSVAANWVLQNIIRPVGPGAFALLDQGFVALKPMDLAACVARQPVYGVRRWSRRAKAWYLWPGFCVFDGGLADMALDFGPDRLLDTDAGGRNWYALYRDLDAEALVWPHLRTVSMPEADGGWSAPKLLVDGWLHVGGLSGLDAARRMFDADPDGLLSRLKDVEPPGA